jgi:hypothetical protein
MVDRLLGRMKPGKEAAKGVVMTPEVPEKH